MIFIVCYFYFFFFFFDWAGSSLLCAGFFLVVESGDYSSLQSVDFSLWWLLLMRTTGSRGHAAVVAMHSLSSYGSWALEHRLRAVVVAHGLNCSVTCGIFPDQGLN